MIALSLIALIAIATAFADIRWLRVAQREHYLPGAVNVFWRRWWFDLPVNIALYSSPLVMVVTSTFWWPAVFLLPLPALIGPIGLGLRGRTSKLVWTRRLKLLALTTAVFQLCLLFVFSLINLAIAALVVPFTAAFVIDIATRFTLPMQKKEQAKFAKKAKERLDQLSPTIVAITGSYGKTSTKNYLAHLINGTKHAVASPASFNNMSGLSRTINEQLSPGTEVFIAEMGTYGPGEIHDLCELIPPDIAMITAIGPVHLERFGSEEAIVKAKSEIFEDAKTCIINIDDERLDALVGELRSKGKRVITASSFNKNGYLRVTTENGETIVRRDGIVIARARGVNAPSTNVACAVAAALEVGVPPEDVAQRLPSIPIPEHRQSIGVSEAGFTIIDDTFNANPASVRRGLDLLVEQAPNGKRVVATPGMVELGERQGEENTLFAQAAADKATDLVIIGRTNRKALLEGANGTPLNTVVVDNLPQAVTWIRQHMGKGDAVLYSNDLPDHYA